IESVGSRPGQGVASTFKFGTAYGVVQGVIGALQIPVEFVSPQRWKKHFRLSGDKEQARAKAQQLFPTCAAAFNLDKHHGRAEAALIARYGFETLFPASAAARISKKQRRSQWNASFRAFPPTSGWHSTRESRRSSLALRASARPRCCEPLIRAIPISSTLRPATLLFRMSILTHSSRAHG